jgi:hypothetical protein
MSRTIKTAPAAEFGEAEFHALAQRLGIDPATAVDPRLGFVVAAARSACRSCESKAQCQLALAMPRLALGDVAPFCPNAERISYLQCSGLKRKG